MFLTLSCTDGIHSLANTWQGYPPESPFVREATPPLLNIGTPTLLTKEDRKSGLVIADAPMLLSQTTGQTAAQASPKTSQALQPTHLSKDLQGTLGELVADTFANTQLREEYLDSNKYFLYRPALKVFGQDGNLYLRPNLRIEERETPNTNLFSSYEEPIGVLHEFNGVDQYTLESIVSEPSSLLSPEGAVSDRSSYVGDFGPPVARRSSTRDLGVGHERIPFALSHIPASQPFNNIRIRSDFQYGWEFPNRAEYLWAGPPNGPKILGEEQEQLDLQEYSLLMETGSDTFSVGTELPLIWLNPSINSNTSGFGDMSIATKLVVLKGRSLQLTQLTRTHIPTGQASSGRGNGHVSMEPGLIARYSKDERTMLHGMVTFLFPIGGNPNFSGEVLEYSFGVARVWYDSDQFAIIPTIESVNWAVLSGAKGNEQNKISGDYISNLQPGLRFVFDRGGDLGLFEAGFGTGFSLTNNHFYESLIRFDLRWSY